MDRRGFLTRSGLALGALVLGDEALEAFGRLTHVRKSFPSADVGTLEGWRVVQDAFCRLAISVDAGVLAGDRTVEWQLSSDARTWRTTHAVRVPQGFNGVILVGPASLDLRGDNDFSGNLRL